MLRVNPSEVGNQESFKYLVGAVTPRPIAFVSTISKDGINNLSPFSFFNVFGANPPILAFSPARRGKDNTTKDTYSNLKETQQCVVHIVTYDMVEQMNQSSAEYDSDVDEFIKSGFTPINSELVKPKRVKESPVHFECELYDIIEVGGKAGSANLAICEIKLIHVREDILDEKGNIDPFKLDAIGRNGGNWYTRANGDAMFEVAKPNSLGIGYDKLPEYILTSNIYSANNLGQFSSFSYIPTYEDAKNYFKEFNPTKSTKESFEVYLRVGDYKNAFKCMLYLSENKIISKIKFEEIGKLALDKKDVAFAWNLAVFSNNLN
jgi:flavin reductase (DIM6/NTAB) family NADH-FMN oxidoreductase RutF